MPDMFSLTYRSIHQTHTQQNILHPLAVYSVVYVCLLASPIFQTLIIISIFPGVKNLMVFGTNQRGGYGRDYQGGSRHNNINSHKNSYNHYTPQNNRYNGGGGGSWHARYNNKTFQLLTSLVHGQTGETLQKDLEKYQTSNKVKESSLL